MEDGRLEKGVRAEWPPGPYSSTAGIREVTLSYFVAENREQSSGKKCQRQFLGEHRRANWGRRLNLSNKFSGEESGWK